MNPIDNPKLTVSRIWFEQACDASRSHSANARLALALYGAHGPDVSGCVRDHFPKEVKDKLRQLARDVTTCLNKAYSNRPPRIRFATIRRLGQEVATKYGSGFYGPQPLRAA